MSTTSEHRLVRLRDEALARAERVQDSSVPDPRGGVTTVGALVADGARIRASVLAEREAGSEEHRRISGGQRLALRALPVLDGLVMFVRRRLVEDDRCRPAGPHGPAVPAAPGTGPGPRRPPSRPGLPRPRAGRPPPGRRPGVLHPGTRRRQRTHLPNDQVPIDEHGRGEAPRHAGPRQRRRRTAVQDARGPARHPRREAPAPVFPRRAPAATQRPPRHDEPGRAAAAPAPRGGDLCRRRPPSPARAPRHDRPLAGQWAQHAHLGGIGPPRPALRRELVTGTGPHHGRNAPHPARRPNAR